MLTLNVPRTDTPPQHAVETRPRATEAWLARLPFASPADTAQQLLLALHTLNRMPLGEDTRYALMALYRPVVARAAASLEVLLAESGVPPHAQQRQTGVLLRELLTEHSIGYKHLLLGLADKRFGLGQAKRASEVTARLLAALRDLQVACYLTYSPLPAGLWQEMHQLYQLARTSEIVDSAATDTLPGSLVYLQALLLALTDPPHLSREAFAHARLYLGKFAALATLAPARGDSSRAGFPVPAGSDRGPALVQTGAEEGGLWLDVETLCRHLHETAVRLRSGESPRQIGLPMGMEETQSQALCKQLLKLWHGNAQRAFKRYPTAGSTVQLVAGVSAIHRLLDRPDPADGEAGELSPGDAGFAFTAPAAVTASRWQVDNDSAAGFALSSTPDAPLNLKVGDPLALRDADEAAWSLAVIRWLKMHDARRVELGVERLSPQVEAAWVQPLRGERKTSPEAALFIPGLAALKQPDRLLLPRHLYQAGLDAEVWHTPRRYTLTFGRRLEHTPSFDLIDFTVFADEPS
jgi:hypothetical protein